MIADARSTGQRSGSRSVPAGHHTVTPYLLVADVARQIEFMKRAFGAKETARFITPDGRILHAEVQIGDSFVMLGGASGEWKPMPCMVHLFVPDTDAVYVSALEAGATPVREPADQFYGDRSGGVVDAEGNQWWISTHVEDVAPEDMERRMREQRGG